MKKYYHFIINMKVMNILSVVLFIIPFVILYLCGYKVDFNFNVLAYLGILFYLILHELFHAFGYSLFCKNKRNIKIGITLEKGIFYAACQEMISRFAIIVSLLFPLIFLSLITFVIGLILSSDLLLIYSIINFGGAIGDILMFVLILKCPSDIQYIDYDNSAGAYLISSEDLSNIKSLGFSLEESGFINNKEVDKSLKRFYISKPSIIYLLIFIFLGIVLLLID